MELSSYESRLCALLFLTCFCLLENSTAEDEKVNVTTAKLSITYMDPETGERQVEMVGEGRYGKESRIDPQFGRLVHVTTAQGTNDACDQPIQRPADANGERWIALVKRGGCNFQTKIMNTMILSDASALLVYNNKEDEKLQTMVHYEDDVVAVFINYSQGRYLSEKVDAGIPITMNITLLDFVVYKVVNKTSTAHHYAPLRTHPAFIIASLGVMVAVVAMLVALLVYSIRRTRLQHSRPMVFHMNGQCHWSNPDDGLLAGEGRDHLIRQPQVNQHFHHHLHRQAPGEAHRQPAV